MKSWRTTIAGIASIVGALALAAVAIFDGDPETVINLERLIESVVAGLVGLGLIMARDDKVTSWESGASRAPRMLMIPLLLGVLFVAGCCPLAIPSKTFLDSVGAEYETYVRQDASLSDQRKSIRLDQVTSFRRAVHQANGLPVPPPN